MDRLLTIDEVCEVINCKKKRIYELVYQKKIPYTKIGQSLRFNRRLIDAWINQKTYIPFDMMKNKQ